MDATGIQENALSTTTLPTFHQFVSLAVAKAEKDLECICRVRTSDQDWSDGDDDVDWAVELALDQVRRIKGVQFASYSAFAREWCKVRAVLYLGTKAHSRTDSAYVRFLNGACGMFEHAADMAFFLQPE